MWNKQCNGTINLFVARPFLPSVNKFCKGAVVYLLSYVCKYKLTNDNDAWPINKSNHASL